MTLSALAPTPQSASPVITPADVADLAALARDLVGITLSDRKAEFLRPGGFLLTGHTEAVHAKRDGLEMIRPSIMRKVQ